MADDIKTMLYRAIATREKKERNTFRLFVCVTAYWLI